MEKLVIDVSHHNGTIDWQKVKPHIYGAIIRCGYGDNLKAQDDRQFERNASECERLGIPYGVYLYSYAKTDAQARSESEHVLRLVKGKKLAFPIYLDLEEPGTEKGAKQRAEIFGNKIESEGYSCGIYANQYWWENHLVGLHRFTKWVARYGKKPVISGTDLWQYTSNGGIDGIKTKVDMNIMYKEIPGMPLVGSITKSPQICYCAFADGKWWDEVCNANDFAGKGEGYEITALGIRVTQGIIKGRVHCGNRWLPWLSFANTYNVSNMLTGILGNYETITGIQFITNIPGYKVHYRVSTVKGDFYPEQVENFIYYNNKIMDGYAGDLKNAIDKFQAWLVKE